MPEIINLIATIPQEHSGKRLDQSLAILFPNYSRECLKKWVISGECLINNMRWQPKTKVAGGEDVTINATLNSINIWQPQALTLNIVYEDLELIVINKPANCVVHPGNGNMDGTLVNALLYNAPELANLPRAGVIHRLDKDTTGLLVVAKTLRAHTNLTMQLQKKSVCRIYEAIICGVLTAGGTINQPIGRHARDRVKMAVITNGREAVTHYRVIKKFSKHTHVRVQLETGRTHQIRVHMAYIKHPVVGDKAYGGRVVLPKQADLELIDVLQCFPRQALHAVSLGLLHPGTQQPVQWQVPLPEDMQQLLRLLRGNMI
jgi:23S rRNA pseudouridine1911/1915/1917 synthase